MNCHAQCQSGMAYCADREWQICPPRHGTKVRHREKAGKQQATEGSLSAHVGVLPDGVALGHVPDDLAGGHRPVRPDDDAVKVRAHGRGVDDLI